MIVMYLFVIEKFNVTLSSKFNLIANFVFRFDVHRNIGSRFTFYFYSFQRTYVLLLLLIKILICFFIPC